MTVPAPDGFAAACRSVGADAPEAALHDAARDLLRRWSGPERGYHDLEHLTEVLTHLAEIDCSAGEVVLAAWFHDAVYRCRPGQDEEDSADLAVEVLTRLGVASSTARRVGDLVLVTAAHDPAAQDADAAALCDADLAILAAPGPRYSAYVAGVRREYRHLDDATFRAGRADVLGRLAARPQLYRTAAGRRRWESAARLNLSTELRSLRDGPTGYPQR
jgi:predicted metal-dependent HD superfamily phosphohydrolase